MTTTPFTWVPLSEDLADEVTAFNDRMAAAGSQERLITEPGIAERPRDPASPVHVESLACMVDGRLRGAVTIKHSPFRIDGTTESVAFPSRPLSEGIVDPAFAIVGTLVLKQVTRRWPLTYGLGVGSLDEPVARLMLALGWAAAPVPFRFIVLRAGPVLRNVKALQEGSVRRAATRVGATTGLGAVFFAAARAVGRLAGRGSSTRGVQVERDVEWGPWVDTLWESARDAYPLVGERSQAVLELLYPEDERPLTRLRIRRGEQTIGWAVVAVAHVRRHRHFGDLTLGSVVDLFAHPDDAAVVARAVAATLRAAGPDLVVVNHSSQSWDRAFAMAGFWRGPTNFFLFLAPALRARFLHNAIPVESYFTRGDGDGPINLW
jgi:hypothetical protein